MLVATIDIDEHLKNTESDEEMLVASKVSIVSRDLSVILVTWSPTGISEYRWCDFCLYMACLNRD